MDRLAAAIAIARTPPLMVVLLAHPMSAWSPMGLALLLGSAAAAASNLGAVFGRAKPWAAAELLHAGLWGVQLLVAPQSSRPAGGLQFALLCAAVACGTAWNRGKARA